MTRYRIFILAAVASAAVLWTHACDGTPPPPPDPPRPTTVTVTPSTAELAALEATAQLAAEVRDQYGDVMANASVSWSSSDVSVAAVDGSGLVTAASNGSATITATSGQASGTAAVTVEQMATTVKVMPADTTVLMSDTLRLAAEVLDANGNLMTEVTLKWSSSNGQVATVTTSGMVTALTEGETEIVAVAGEARGTSEITVRNPDRDALAVLYRATGGPNWANSHLWLTDSPLGEWAGVTTDTVGRVTALGLRWNQLSGEIPRELGRLTYLTHLDLRDSRLSGGIPPELGNLENLTDMLLARNQLSGEIPPEFGDLTNLRALDLGANLQLSGEIPPELGNLTNLRFLHLGQNQLSGDIPPELGNLKNVTELILSWNLLLSGKIPPELGRLANLKVLSLGTTRLTGGIPPEFGNLVSLEEMWLFDTRLTEPLPPEIGNLAKLRILALYKNDLTGEIPPEIGNLENLEIIWLEGSELTGSIPPEIGRLENLLHLRLDHNRLSGELPPEIGNLGNLTILRLDDNHALSGPLPRTMTGLTRLSTLVTGGTELCAPADPEFRKWLGGVSTSVVAICDTPVAHLTQAVQSRTYPVPLVAGEKALLRVFLTAREANNEDIPGARVRFLVDGSEIHSQEIPGKSGPIPTEADEGHLWKSANAQIAGEVIREGLEMVIEVDSVDADLGVPRRIPETGHLPVDVRQVPPFDLTMIPFIWTEDPDSQIVALTGEMADDPTGHQLLWETRTLIPVGSVTVTQHDPVEISSNSAFTILSETEVIRVLENGTGHYMGLMSGEVTGASGVAHRPGRSSFAIPAGWIMAHELGHNMSALHAPCGDGTIGSRDPYYPHDDGSIGGWGWDFRDGGRLVGPSTWDVMSYCGPRWISDYHFTRMARFRLSEAASHGSPRPASPAESLLLWGGVDEEGSLFLEPAFNVVARPQLPAEGGEYLLTGRGAGGTELFSLSFDMLEVADGDGRSAFVFVLPARSGWVDALESITLAGPGGEVTLDGESDNPLAIVRDRLTGTVRAFLREAPTDQPPSVEVLFSRGIPR